MKIILTILFFWSATVSFAQDSTFKLVRTFTGDIAAAAVDHLDHIYLISSSGQIKKVDAAGDSVAIYNQARNFGRLYSIDVSNPLKVLLFYKDFSTVVILDRLLASRATIDLRKFSVLQPGAIGLSYDNNIWVFDEYDGKLKKFDEQGTKLLETPDLRNQFAVTVTPQRIINDDGLVYLADSAHGIFVFDNYGTYKKRFDLKQWRNLEVRKGIVIRTRTDEILVYNPTTFTDHSRKIPSTFQPYIHSFTSGDRLITLGNNTLRIYQFRF